MSIKLQNGVYVPTCDICSDALPGKEDFYDALAEKKAAGWRIRRYGDNWQDLCPDCFWGNSK